MLDCFTSHDRALELAKPVHGGHAMPDWWRALPKEKLLDADLSPLVNMRRCLGLTDLYARSVVLPLWSDMVLEVGPAGSDSWRFRFADRQTTAEIHAESQHAGFAPRDRLQHFKLMSPWAFETRENISWVVTGAAWSNPYVGEITVMPGVCNFFEQASTNVNLFVTRHPLETKQFVLELGTPMMHLVPVSERRVELRHHLVDHADFVRRVTVDPMFFGAGRRRRNMARKCPFHAS